MAEKMDIGFMKLSELVSNPKYAPIVAELSSELGFDKKHVDEYVKTKEIEKSKKDIVCDLKIFLHDKSDDDIIQIVSYIMLHYLTIYDVYTGARAFDALTIKCIEKAILKLQKNTGINI